MEEKIKIISIIGMIIYGIISSIGGIVFAGRLVKLIFKMMGCRQMKQDKRIIQKTASYKDYRNCCRE